MGMTCTFKLVVRERELRMTREEMQQRK